MSAMTAHHRNEPGSATPIRSPAHQPRRVQEHGPLEPRERVSAQRSASPYAGGVRPLWPGRSRSCPESSAWSGVLQSIVGLYFDLARGLGIIVSSPTVRSSAEWFDDCPTRSSACDHPARTHSSRHHLHRRRSDRPANRASPLVRFVGHIGWLIVQPPSSPRSV